MERDEKKSSSQSSLSSRSVSRKGSARCFLWLHGVPLSLYSSAILSPFPSLPSPSLRFSLPKTRVTAIYFTSEPLYVLRPLCILAGRSCLKGFSDKTMNKFSGFSPLVSLRVAGVPILSELWRKVALSLLLLRLMFLAAFKIKLQTQTQTPDSLHDTVSSTM